MAAIVRPRPRLGKPHWQPMAPYSYARSLDRGILYDTVADPDQLANRYGNRACAALQPRLEDAMRQLLAERGDRFLPAARQAARPALHQ